MKRRDGIQVLKKNGLTVSTQFVTDTISRMALSNRMGFSYGDKRKLYQALGYPDESELTFQYFLNKYERHSIARAVINRPSERTWSGDLYVVPKEGDGVQSELNKQWGKLNKKLKIKQRLCKADKLREIGRFSLVLFGFDDVKDSKGFTLPVSGTRKLLYIRQVAESEVGIDKYEDNSANPRYGLPLLYSIKVGTVGTISPAGTQLTSITSPTKTISVHYSRVLHLVNNNLTSELEGTPKLKPIINNLIDLEKIMGGDAEMFWRGARPGYTAIAKDEYEMTPDAEEDLEGELNKYEHDLRRFISAKGVDIKALEQQVAQPKEHADIQLAAISAETGIPIRILIGSERGELASSQDSDEWKTLIKTRQEEDVEPTILRPFIEKCMELGILPKEEEFNVMWEDPFSSSELSKVEMGKKRSEALKTYAESPFATDILVPKLAFKYLLGLNEEQVQEALEAMQEEAFSEQDVMDKIKEDAAEMEIDKEVKKAKALPKPVPAKPVPTQPIRRTR